MPSVSLVRAGCWLGRCVALALCLAVAGAGVGCSLAGLAGLTRLLAVGSASSRGLPGLRGLPHLSLRQAQRPRLWGSRGLPLRSVWVAVWTVARFVLVALQASVARWPCRAGRFCADGRVCVSLVQPQVRSRVRPGSSGSRGSPGSSLRQAQRPRLRGLPRPMQAGLQPVSR